MENVLQYAEVLYKQFFERFFKGWKSSSVALSEEPNPALFLGVWYEMTLKEPAL